jgi:protein tyrosine phosphatase
MHQGVKWLYDILQESKGYAYVHCKAGRGRSATLIICYLLKYGTTKHGIPKEQIDTLGKAITYATSKRGVININPAQRKAIETFYANKVYGGVYDCFFSS